MDIVSLVTGFFVDPRTLGALALILIDLLTGIAAAVKLSTFAWTKVEAVLHTEIAPFVEGYLALYLVGYAGLEPFLGAYTSPTAAAAIVTTLTTIAAGFSYLPILTSIGRNYLELRDGERVPAA